MVLWMRCRRGSSSSDLTNELTVIGAVLVCAGGLGLGIPICASVVDTKSTYNGLSRMISVDTGSHQMEAMFVALYVACAAMLISGILGVTAVYWASKYVMANYILLNSLLAVWMVFSYAYCTMLSELVAPVSARQGAEFCNVAMHPTYFKELGCNTTVDDLAWDLYPRNCEIDCQSRVQMLRKMGGCNFLRNLCYDHVYSDVGKGTCITKPINNTTLGAVLHPNRFLSQDVGTVQDVVHISTSQTLPGKTVDQLVANQMPSGATLPAGIAQGKNGQAGSVPVLDTMQHNMPHFSGNTRNVLSLESISHCCQRVCDRQKLCTGYYYGRSDEGCYLITPSPIPSSAPPDCKGVRLSTSVAANVSGITPSIRRAFPDDPKDVFAADSAYSSVVGSDSQQGFRCFRKELIPRLTRSLGRFCLELLVGIGTCVVLMLLSTICACHLQYSLITRRQGRKGALALLKKMHCPCYDAYDGRVNKVKGQRLADCDSESSFETDSEF